MAALKLQEIFPLLFQSLSIGRLPQLLLLLGECFLEVAIVPGYDVRKTDTNYLSFTSLNCADASFFAVRKSASFINLSSFNLACAASSVSRSF